MYVAHLSLLLPPVGAVAPQNCPSPCLEEPRVPTAEINTIIHINGTVNTTYTSGTVTYYVDAVMCYRDNGIHIERSYSAGIIVIPYTVLEGPVEIFCNSTCGHIDKHGKSNIITIIGEGEICGIQWLMLWCTYRSVITI